MIAKQKPSALTWREAAGYLFVLTLVGLGIVFLWMGTRMFSPRGDWHDLGPIQDLEITEPTPHYLIAEDGMRVTVWVVYADNDWYAFDGVTPDSYNTHCSYRYQPVTSRFEDPCTGFKYSLNGEYINESLYAQDITVQNLNQYVVVIRDGHLNVDLSQRIEGKKWRAISTPSLLP